VPLWDEQDPQRRAIEQRLPPDHLARRIDQAVARLDLQALHARYGGTGSEPYPPALLLRAVLYETHLGYHSPAEWYRHAHENEPVRWLLGGLTPSRSCWYAFRDRVGAVLPALNQQPLAQAQAEGLTTATRGALDGTLVAAHASRHRLVNEATLHKRAAQLAAARAAAGDPGAGVAPPATEEGAGRSAARTAGSPERAADPAPGVAPARASPDGGPVRPAWMAPSAAGRQQQQQRLQQAQNRMAELQARNQAKRSSKRQAPAKLVVSLSDPEAALGRDKEDVYRPLYNVQVVDDLDGPFVLGYEVFAQPNDAGLLGPMLARLRESLGHQVEVLLTDTAYASGADLADAAAAGVALYAPLPEVTEQAGKQIPKGAFAWDVAEQTYVCPQGHRLVYEGSRLQKRSGTEAVVLHGYRCPPAQCRECPVRARCTANPEAGRTISRSEHEGLIEALRERMGTPEAKALYRLRRQTVELVNADWKEHRKLRRFSGRGLAKARCQVGLMVLTHNLLTLLAEEKKAKASAATDVTPRDVAA
jgi:transposase